MDAKDLLWAFKESISKNEFDNYLANLEFSEKLSRADTLVFLAQNELMGRFVQSRYVPKLEYFYEAKTGVKAKIIIQSVNLKPTRSRVKLDVASIKAQSTILNTTYTFENFVVGDSNNYAYTTCKASINKDKFGKAFNPIFIYGASGLGKTHLLQAFGNACLEQGRKIIYATSENFINDFTSHLANKTMEKFREKYRNCDALLIDDVQFLGKTEKIQEEFFFTFNEVKEHFGQIIMTSDSPPNMLKGITERLKSRFEHGIIADITPPELETKITIIRKKCDFNDIKLDDEIIKYVATSMGDNIREIEGVLANLNAYIRLIKQDITMDIIKSLLKDHIKERKESVNIDEIVLAVCKEYNLKAADIKSNKKTQQIVLARRIIISLARELTTLSMPSLAKFFEMKDHTAISHNVKKINEDISKNEDLKYKINELKTKILAKKNQSCEIM